MYRGTTGGGKAEAAAVEIFELAILQEYLPTMADEAVCHAHQML